MPKNQKNSSFKIVNLLTIWAISFTILFAFLSADFFYYFNYLEIFPSELILPLVSILIVSLISALAVYFVPWPKLMASKILTIIIFSFSFYNYDVRLNWVAPLFRGVLPFLPNTDLPIISPIFLISLFVISVLIGIALDVWLKKGKTNPKKVAEFLVVFIIAIGIMQFLHMAIVMPSVFRQSKTTASLESGQKSKPSQKPDVYYIVLDRYASNSILKSQFNFDNNQFLDTLRQNNFTVNDNATSNYPITAISISSTINAKYTNQEVATYKNQTIQSRTLYHNLIQQSAVTKAFVQNGYKFYQIGSDYDATNYAPLGQNLSFSYQIQAGSYKKNLRTFEVSEFSKSPLRQLFKVTLGWWPFKSIEKDKVKFVGDQLDSLNYLANQPGGGRFIFAHILMPHDPFVFNKDGSISPYNATDNFGKSIKSKYLDQLQYINSEITKTVNTIINKSNGQAVILLNADEGAHPQDMNQTAFSLPVPLDYMEKSDMSTWPNDWLKMKFGILQAVHIPKASEGDLNHLASVNLFRIVLNQYLGYNLSYLPNCNFGFANGDTYEFNYKNITGLVQSSNNDKCSAYQSLKTM